MSRVCATGLRDRGHEVQVIAAHPHYPEPRWGYRLRPYQEVRDGISVLRLPLWIGRTTAAQRYRQELSFMTALALATPLLPASDVIVSASPSFPALLPAIANVRLRQTPWVLWLHDLLPDGATSVGLVPDDGLVLTLSRRLEISAYETAERIIVLSRAFTANLVAKGVSADKIELIYDPATRDPKRKGAPRAAGPSLRILSMGNIGRSQGLTNLVRAFEARPDLTSDAQLVITGTGTAAADARAQIRSARVDMLGMVDDQELERELNRADVGLVSQQYQGAEFNIPSKLMNFMAYGLPILAAVNPESEVAHIVRESKAGWIVDSSDPDALPRTIARIAASPEEVREFGQAARRHAELHFTRTMFAERFEHALGHALEAGARRPDTG